MPTPILKKLAPFEGVGPGQQATLDLPIGPNYQAIILEATITPASGGTAALSQIMDMIHVLVNGKDQRQFTGVEISELNPLNGEEFRVETENITNPGDPLGVDDTARFKVAILFGEPFRKSYALDKAMAWPTTWPGTPPVTIGTLQLQIDVPDVTGTAGHKIEAFAEYDMELGKLDEGGSPIFNITKWWRQVFTYSGAGERFITTLPKRDRYLSLHFFSQPGDPIERIRIKRDNDVLLDNIPKRINDHNLVKAGINPLALSPDRFDVIFDRDDILDSGSLMRGVSELEVVLDIANGAAGNKAITLISQVYGPRD